LTDAAWTNVENGCALYFYTTDANNSQTNVLKIDSNKKSTFNGVIDVTDTTDSSDATGDTGALRVEGGASIAKKLFVGENLTVTGDLTVNGTTTTVSTTNTVVSDKLLELANGTSGTPSGDAGIIIERGSSNNAAIIWDESTDTFVVGTTTATGASTGDLSVTDAAFQAAAITASCDISTTGEIKTAKVSFTDGDDAITIADGGGITANTSLTLASGATVTAINDEDNMTSNSATALATQQSIKAYVDSQTSGSGNMDNWILEDDDGTEVTVSNGKEVKFIGSGITTNFTDVSDGTDADPFDLTFTVDAAQTGITSVVNSSLEIGRDADNRIKFGTDNQIIFEVGGSDGVTFKTSGEIEASSLDISGDADIDGTLEADAITVGGTALNTVIAGVTVTNATDAVNSSHVLVTDNESTDEENLITFVEGATSSTGNVGLEMDGNLTYNPSSGRLTATQLAGTLTTAAQANITSVGTLTALQVDQINANASTLTITDSTDTGDLCTIAVGTHGATTITTVDDDAAAADLTLDIDGDIVLDSAEGKWRLKKDGSTKLKIDHGNAGDITIENGTQDKDIIFKGDDGGGVITALTLDMSEAGAATFNNKVVATELDISGDADIDGTLEADAITVDGTNLLTGGVITSLGTITQDTVTFTSANSEDPLVIIKNTTNDANGARLQFVKDKGAAGADGDDIGVIEFIGDDAAQTQTSFAKIVAEVSEADDSDEAGKLSFFVAESDGTTTALTAGLVIEGEHATDGQVNVTLGAGVQSVTNTSGKFGVFDTTPMTAINVVNNYNTVTFENQLASGEGGGRVMRYSPGADDTLTVGRLYFLHTDGTWDETDADAVATGATQLLGIGLGNARTAGCLMEGFIRIPSTEIEGTPGSGAVDGLPLYVSTTAGHITFTRPSAAGDFVRIVGHAIDDHSSDVLIYFNPSNNHVEL